MSQDFSINFMLPHQTIKITYEQYLENVNAYFDWV
jgi:hypothetical protein